MSKHLEKWLKHDFSTGVKTGEDYLKFQREAKANLKKQANAAGYTLHSFHKNHYCFSAVLHHAETNKFIFISISDVRFFKNEWYTHVLYRTMKYEKDWTGGQNHYCQWEDIGKVISRTFN